MAKGRPATALIRRILLPTDGSTEALEAAEYAAEIARAFGARVTLLNVVDVPRIPHQFLKAPETQLRQELAEAGNSILALTRKALSDAGVAADIELREGRPGDTIVLAAVQGKYDLVIMGSRGLAPSESLFLGSVSDHVARYAPCPVLIVRGGQAATAARGAGS